MTFELLAYKKAYFHALKFITSDVIGVLVGRVDGNKVIVEDAYPLFHSRVVSPTLESAFELIGGVLSKKNQVIVGVYEGLIQQGGPNRQLSEVAARILEGIETKLKPVAPIALRIVDEDKTNVESIDEEVIPYHYLTSEGFKFSLKDAKSLESNFQKDSELTKEKGLEAFEKMAEDIRKNKHRLIVDFDMHFEDISLDFTNSYL